MGDVLEHAEPRAQRGFGRPQPLGLRQQLRKALIDELIRDRARQLGDLFTRRGFFDDVTGAGMMPVSLIRWQLTGEK